MKRDVGKAKLQDSMLSPMYITLSGNGDRSTSARLMVDLPAPSGPISATENLGNLMLNSVLSGLRQFSL